MNLPNRADTHITESASRTVLADKAPKTWIIRELTERDYGVDAYIEICSKQNEVTVVTGDFFLAQLKGTETAIKWLNDTPPKPRYFTFSGTEIATVNYWMRLGVPVFLLVVECNTNRVFFANIKEQVRARYDEFLNQSTFGFKMIEAHELGTPDGGRFLQCEYELEKNFAEFQSKAITLLCSWQKYLDFIEANSGLDYHMEVEPEDQLQFVHIYQTCNFSASWLGIDWNIPSLKRLYSEDEANFHSGYYTLHNHALHQVFPQVKVKTIEVLRELFKLVVVTEQAYWEKQNPVVSRLCSFFWHNQRNYPNIFPNPTP
jgi:hypothetical protein